MAGKIRILSDQTINQIAAGEVIENPASVVKELVENAIDAGSTHVKVEILGGGFQLIKISDDGSGMAPEDAVLCLERHATSKIVDAEDLFALNTMGFRGEALASIAAISKMRLLTALENAPAIDLEVEGGAVLCCGPAARSRGTTIEVRSLFYNVPARKKFQKCPAASSAEITKVMTQLALAHPEVGFELTQQTRSHFSLPALSDLKKRVEDLLGPEYLDSCRNFEVKEENCEGWGFVAEPLFSRPNRSGQYLFINRRPVFCPSVSYAIRDAYGTRLNSDRHPVYVLHLTIPPDLVDVNVHPQKREVRLREESLLKHALHSAVNEALGSAVIVQKETVDFSNFFTKPSYVDFSEGLTLKEEEEPAQVENLPMELPLHLIGLFGRYLLVDAQSFPSVNTSGVIWVDLPAAEARVQFEALIKNSAKTPISQGLLFPVTVSFSRAEAELLKTHTDTLHKLGLHARESGQSGFIIDAIPPFVREEELHAILMEVLEETNSDERLRRLASTLCRKARFRRQWYSLEEAKVIVLKLLKTDDPLHCPQGKRTLFHVTEEEIERQFT